MKDQNRAPEYMPHGPARLANPVRNPIDVLFERLKVQAEQIASLQMQVARLSAKISILENVPGCAKQMVE